MYIYDLPEFKIPKEFQDWLVWAWNWQQASDWSVVDLSGNWHNWTPNWWVVFSRKNNTHFMQFDGSDDHVSFPTWIVDLDNTFSIFSIFSSNDVTKYQGVVMFEWERDTWLRVDSSHITAQFYNGGTDAYLYSPTIENNKIYTATYVRDKSKWMKLYVWTNLVDSNTATWNASSNQRTNAIWWKDEWDNGNHFDWHIHLVLVYNKALSPTQIQKMYEYFRQWYHD